MVRAHAIEFVAEASMLLASAGFLAWYVWAKLAVWPWGSCRILPW